MKISELKSAIREMIISELEEATYAGKDAKADLQKDPKFGSLNAQAKTAALKDLESGGSVTLQEEDALMEMAKIAGDLKVAIEKVIEKNKDAEKKDVRKAIKADDDVQAALGPDDDLFDNQLNKFIDLVRGEREVGQRGRKADPNKPAKEPKEKKAKEPKTSAAKKEPKFSTSKLSKSYTTDDEEGPSDLELRKLAKSGGEFTKGKAAQLRAQEKGKLVKAFLKDMRDKGIVDNANRVLDKEKYADAWSKAKIEIEDKVSKLS
jgi:hypothetical protein